MPWPISLWSTCVHVSTDIIASQHVNGIASARYILMVNGANISLFSMRHAWTIRINKRTFVMVWVVTVNISLLRTFAQDAAHEPVQDVHSLKNFAFGYHQKPILLRRGSSERTRLDTFLNNEGSSTGRYFAPESPHLGPFQGPSHPEHVTWSLCYTCRKPCFRAENGRDWGRDPHHPLPPTNRWPLQVGLIQIK